MHHGLWKKNSCRRIPELLQLAMRELRARSQARLGPKKLLKPCCRREGDRVLGVGRGVEVVLGAQYDVSMAHGIMKRCPKGACTKVLATDQAEDVHSLQALQGLALGVRAAVPGMPDLGQKRRARQGTPDVLGNDWPS